MTGCLTGKMGVEPILPIRWPTTFGKIIKLHNDEVGDCNGVVVGMCKHTFLLDKFNVIFSALKIPAQIVNMKQLWYIYVMLMARDIIWIHKLRCCCFGGTREPGLCFQHNFHEAEGNLLSFRNAAGVAMSHKRSFFAPIEFHRCLKAE